MRQQEESEGGAAHEQRRGQVGKERGTLERAKQKSAGKEAMMYLMILKAKQRSLALLRIQRGGGTPVIIIVVIIRIRIIRIRLRIPEAGGQKGFGKECPGKRF
jgi:hypothetical protein